MSPIRSLFRFEQLSGLLALGSLLIALGLANSPLAALYELVHHTPLEVRVGALSLNKPLFLWINEGLMVFFFLLIGLELKRNFLEGQLSTTSQIALPGIAALGGMLVPGAIFAALTWPDPELLRGWAIPTATDIVLALSCLSFLGSRVPLALKLFLTAIAVFDDIGAVLIIALFYGDGLSLPAIAVAVLALIGLLVLNRCGILRAPPYVLLSLLLWFALLESGVHATLAGILIGAAIPMRSRDNPSFSPLRKVEQELHSWVSLGVIPLFVFFNSGISLAETTLGSFAAPTTLAVALGLFVGKPVGISGAVLLALKSGVTRLPEKTTLGQFYAVSILAGIGFTMSLFISSLAYADLRLIISAKLAILIGSAASGIVGLTVLRLMTAPKTVDIGIGRTASHPSKGLDR